MATIVKSFTFSSGATIVAAEHNSNFDTIYNDYNGNINNNNIVSTAAIAVSKLAPGSARQVLTTNSGATSPEWINGANGCSFQVRKSGDQSDVATNTNVNVTWETEVFDLGGNFASDTFTAPTTGKYLLTVSLNFGDFDSACSYVQMSITTTNRAYDFYCYGADMANDSGLTRSFTTIADLSATNIAWVYVYQSGGAKQLDISSGNGTYFCGALLV